MTKLSRTVVYDCLLEPEYQARRGDMARTLLIPPDLKETVYEWFEHGSSISDITQTWTKNDRDIEYFEVVTDFGLLRVMAHPAMTGKIQLWSNDLVHLRSALRCD